MIRAEELIVDNFAGGGGASTGILWATGRHIDIAINHDKSAIAMHQLNHPETRHLAEDVFDVDPVEVCGGRPVGLAWFSPDCKHFSKAKGGKPVEKRIRGLAWIVHRWASTVRPRIIILENVEEFKTWGPIGPDGQPIKSKEGVTFRLWWKQLEKMGYMVECRELRACDYGTPTIRKRLFVVARCDGQPIVWPDATHGPGLLPYRTAAECVDWSIPCPSIFLTKEEGRAIGVHRPLAENTLKRIAAGVRRFVIDSADPFIVPITHSGGETRTLGIDEPLRTVTTARRGEFALIAPSIVGVGGRMGQSSPRSANAPYHTMTTKGDSALVAAFLAQHNGGIVGHRADKPLSTLTGRCTQQQLVTSHLMKLKGTCRHGQAVNEPMPTIQAGGHHIAEVRSFLIQYYSSGSGKVGRSIHKPAPTITTNDRIGLVTIQGVDYQIVDIGMRMLTPRELFLAQGFKPDYKIEGFTKTDAVRMVGNSVCPPLAEAIVRAQLNVGAAREVASQ